ncbi:sulfotransferase domain-containing protein [Streptomyces sp. NPDC052496]|uniref:sulfotransferase domain-containing protein n=1 Tax=Streptomyces sp. NPDC052496 TaxID=3154951 RepID=UPI0034463575
MGFGLHYHNMAFLQTDDVIMPSIGGAGSSLLGNIILELGLGYIDLNRDRLIDDTTVHLADDAISRRIRGYPPSAEGSVQSSHEPSLHAVHCPRPRLMKTHLPSEEFDGYNFGSVLLLVRDPRDALYSWYRYHRGFAQLEWEKVPDTFTEFLRMPFFTGRPPAEAWAIYYRDWLSAAQRASACHVLRFEDLKADAARAMREAFAALSIAVDETELRRAADHSSYEAMRAREDAVVARQTERQEAVSGPGQPEARVMRSGKVGGWRDWMTPELGNHFAVPELRRLARRFGYDLETST